jgi:biopolymer transport protein ExbD
MTVRLEENRRTDASESAVDTDLTPMIDVAFLIIIFFMCLPFKTLDGKLQSFLPTGPGIDPVDADRPEIFWIKVHVVGRDDRERTWGPPDRRSVVPAPTRVVYRFEDGTHTEDLAQVGAYVRRIKSAAAEFERGTVRGEIKARPRVPHKAIIAVMNQFLAQGVKDVDFYGTALPGRRQLDSPSLPYPEDR